MRLTADLILRSPTFENCLKQRELDLRGNKIPFIENLGATHDEYEALDLSDNEIGKLDNFPLLKRLVQLFVSNNRIARLSPNLQRSLPGLETLILANNRIEKLGDLSPLRGFPSLRYLSLLGNPVEKEANYRLYVIHLLPNLRFLDYQKVKIKEKREARSIFGDNKKKGNTFDPHTGLEASDGPSKELLAKVKDALLKAESMEAVQRLEQALASGDPKKIENVLSVSPPGTNGQDGEEDTTDMTGVEATT